MVASGEKKKKKRLDLYGRTVIFTSNCTFLWHAISLCPTSKVSTTTDIAKSYSLEEWKQDSRLWTPRWHLWCPRTDLECIIWKGLDEAADKGKERVGKENCLSLEPQVSQGSTTYATISSAFLYTASFYGNYKAQAKSGWLTMSMPIDTCH